ncbi:hypothetical protein NEOLEDRAFT_681249 [Neolentinus lepideus HHB14362 ss-1]|uniref:Uncharacterized protein n=1 Tax=Neolentinus lepideus HHB14362 ss-1 TaxID=1314782 RepID=A0A165QA30_9AGAM|nr:hypothetical protein NEOLEDRAFT_681249 [Neolentinus lepideus HHB14362 ss-1]
MNSAIGNMANEFRTSKHTLLFHERRTWKHFKCSTSIHRGSWLMLGCWSGMAAFWAGGARMIPVPMKIYLTKWTTRKLSRLISNVLTSSFHLTDPSSTCLSLFPLRTLH